MRVIKKNIKKTVLSLLIFLEIFVLTSVQTGIVRGADLIPVNLNNVGPTPDLSDNDFKGPTLQVIFNKNASEISYDGEEIPAQAIPSDFNKEDKELYFTWYLKRENGTSLDEDSDYDKDDWKIEAARIMARNGFNGEQSGNGALDGDKDKHEAWPSWNDENNSANSKPNCYVQDFENGGVYELKETKEEFECANGSTSVCVSTKNLTCAGDVVPNKQTCQKVDDSELVCDVTDVDKFETSVECPSGSTAVCVEDDDGTAEVERAFDNDATQAEMCSTIGSANSGAACPAAVADTLDENESITAAGTAPTCSFEEEDDGNICKHLFAQPRGTGEKTGDGEFGDEEESFWGTDNRNISTAGNGNVDEANVAGLGINKFTWEYKQGDEIGVAVEGETVFDTKHHDGTKMIMWAFSRNTCDAISDAVEDNSKRRFYIQNTYGLQEGIASIGEIDLNDCLEENLIDPSLEVENSAYLEVSLSHTPSSPLNDSFTEGALNRGDLVNVLSETTNTNNPDNLSYKWSIYKSSDGTSSPLSWTDITDDIKEHSQFSGLNVASFNFKLNFLSTDTVSLREEDYLKVKVEVSENGNSAKSGNKYVIIKIGQLGANITPRGTVVQNGKLSSGEEICDSYSGESCLVSKNEIVSLSVPDEENSLENFSWKMNGGSLVCNKNVSSSCSDSQAVNLAFFPATGNIGDEIEITAEATEKSTGLLKKFSKKFRIIEPYVKIISSDNNLAWAKNVGFFKQLDGTYVPDLSDKLFQATPGSKVKLKAAFFPESIGLSDQTMVKWQINGADFSGNDKAEIELAVDETAGNIYNVDVRAVVSQSAEIRTALANIWGISQSETGETIVENSIQVEVIQNEYLGLIKGTKNVLASVASNVPDQVMFLLRIILAIAFLVFFPRIIFSLFPGFKNEK